MTSLPAPIAAMSGVWWLLLTRSRPGTFAMPGCVEHAWQARRHKS